MFGVTSIPSLTIVKPPNAGLGYLGIGTDEPKEMAHVVGKLLIERTEDVASSLQFRHPNKRGESGGGGLVLAPNYWDIYSDVNGLKFNTFSNNSSAGTQQMIISSNGNVGIGVATPQEKLHVDKNILAEGKITTLNSFILAPDNDSNSEHWEILRTNAGLNFGYYHEPYNVKTLDIANVLFIGNTGAVGIGHTNPSARLDVDGLVKAQSANISGTITGGALSAQSANITGAITGSALTINSNANISGSLTANALTAQSANINGAIAATGANINGKIKTKEVEVTLIGWGDFVFEEDYKLLTLAEVEQFIKENKHLPNVPSAAEVEANGINLGEMNNILIQKVEELTLYILDLQKQINELKTK